MERERIGSRIGFIFLAAACAIGLGNVWRFPYIAGENGGGFFVLIFLVFLVILGIPILSMEFAVGRASRKSVALSFQELQPKGTKWHWFSWFAMAGNYLLMGFYTVITGWMLIYLVKAINGEFNGASPDQIGASFEGMVTNPGQLLLWMAFTVAFGFGVCAFGLRKGVERVTKLMMGALLVILFVLVFRAVTLPGASEGLKFFLVPNFERMVHNGIWRTFYEAMGHAFFTLSIGMGSMAIFGSYIGKERRLTGEAGFVMILDTSASILAGVIVFSACFAFAAEPDSGPGLVFMTLPNVFNHMPGGYFWAVLFFLFMSFAALSTVITVFENILAFAMDLTGCSRIKSICINIVVIMVLAIPIALGFSTWGHIQPMGEDTMFLDLYDFIVSKNILPLGGLIYLLFCMSKRGWGFKNFLEEVNAGQGAKFPANLKIYFTYILPILIMFVFIMGYLEQFKVLERLGL